MNDGITERNKFKKLFANATSRSLLGAWLLVKGSRFSLRLVADLISIPEDAVDSKLQTLAGMGLVHTMTDAQGERQVEFLAPTAPEVEKMVWELFESRKNDFETVEQKIRALVYKTLLASPL